MHVRIRRKGESEAFLAVVLYVPAILEMAELAVLIDRQAEDRVDSFALLTLFTHLLTNSLQTIHTPFRM